MQEMFFRRDMSSDNLICKVERQQHNMSQRHERHDLHYSTEKYCGNVPVDLVNSTERR